MNDDNRNNQHTGIATAAGQGLEGKMEIRGLMIRIPSKITSAFCSLSLRERVRVRDINREVIRDGNLTVSVGRNNQRTLRRKVSNRWRITLSLMLSKALSAV